MLVRVILALLSASTLVSASTKPASPVGPYPIINNSESTDPHVYFARRGVPCGVLVHTTAATNSLSWLQGASYRAGSTASADFLIERSGVTHRIVPWGKAAYHAGVSSLTLNDCTVFGKSLYMGDDVSNALIGVELEDTASQVPTFEQINALAYLLVTEGVAYGWRWPYNIYGHYSVARPLGRRSDPTNFQWGSLMGRIYSWAIAENVGGLP